MFTYTPLLVPFFCRPPKLKENVVIAAEVTKGVAEKKPEGIIVEGQQDDEVSPFTLPNIEYASCY